VRGDLRAVQAFVLPSKQEPYPVAVLEALAAGVPCVVTDDTGLSPRLAELGAACVNDGSPEEIARDVLSLIDSEDRWTAVASAGRRFAEDEVSIEEVAERVSAAYATLLADAR
jgi:glycosyltransferase involved in cell wall biosynthesis